MRNPTALLTSSIAILWLLLFNKRISILQFKQHRTIADGSSTKTKESSSSLGDSISGISSSCTISADCAFNGECKKSDSSENDPEISGSCRCFSGWKGDTCETLDVLPVNPAQLGLQLHNHDFSTWGGSVSYDDDSRMYHMFASEIVNNCGLYSWTTNSRVVRAVSKSPLGPYQRVQVIVPVFAHDANVIRSPSGEWVLFVTALRGIKPRDCRNGTMPEYLKTDELPPPKDTYMLWAERPQGPWSQPVMVLNSTKYNSEYWAKHNKTAICDTNLNGIILGDSKTFVGIWRHCESDELLTIPHLLTASNWKDPSTYVPHVNAPLFVLEGSGAEDPSNIWITRTSDMKPGQVAFHSLFHDEQATRCMLGACGGIGRHAYSLSDIHGMCTGAWRYATVDAYDRHVAFANGTVLASDTRARPHVILDPGTHRPIAFSTGLKESDESGYCWTLVAPLRITNGIDDGARVA